MTLQDELRVMLEKARRYIKAAAVLQLEADVRERAGTAAELYVLR